MNKWLIGCGTALGIVVLVAIGAGYYAWQQGKQIRGSVHEITRAYLDLDRQYPFTPPTDGSIDPERFRKFLEVRQPVAAAIRQALGTAKEKGFADRMRMVLTLVRNLGTVHVAALQAAAMSLDEYHYLARETVTVLRTAAAMDSTQRDPDLTEIRNAMLGFQKTLGNMRIHSDGERVNDLDLGVISINPAHIVVPAGNRLALVQNKQAVLETVPAYLLDLFLPTILDSMRKESAPASAGAAERP